MKKLEVYFDGVFVCDYSDYDRAVCDSEKKLYLIFNDKDEVIGSIPFSYMILKKEK